jgi:hypothetical protein
MKPLGRHSPRGNDNIKMDLKETENECVEWIHMAPDREQWRALVRVP